MSRLPNVCDHPNCSRMATTKNLQYFPDKWLCTFHANKATKEGRLKRKNNNTQTFTHKND